MVWYLIPPIDDGYLINGYSVIAFGVCLFILWVGTGGAWIFNETTVPQTPSSRIRTFLLVTLSFGVTLPGSIGVTLWWGRDWADFACSTLPLLMFAGHVVAVTLLLAWLAYRDRRQSA